MVFICILRNCSVNFMMLHAIPKFEDLLLAVDVYKYVSY